ncbi:MAG: methyltransferase [Paludibacter sp.]|nr:methyltransferase [Paludibacter sp.]
MSNPYFKFKQFTVYHDLCAMKVGIDGVLLGAWSPLDVNMASILDVGTGSGLITLMLAQRTANAHIDAIDIDEGAISQATINCDKSPWRDRISVQNISLQDFAPACTRKYDLIVSNPPYFTNSLKAPDPTRSKARHTDTISHQELLLHSAGILKKTGRICLILPVTEGLQCVKYAESFSLFCYQCIYVHPKPEAEAKRVLLEFGFTERTTLISNLEIETLQRHSYSEAFTQLAKDFYLKL